jgi:hypothetical protein
MNKKFKSFWNSWRRTLLFFVLIIIAGLFFRIYNLTNLPIFGDEAIYVRWSQIMRVDATLRFVPLSDGKQPLFMWSVIPFLRLFSDPLFAGRLVSVLTGLGSIVGVFVLTSILFKKQKVSLIATLFYAISPYSVFFDRMALVDSMLTFFGIWTLTFAVVTVKKIRLDTAMIAGFFLGGAFLTKSPAVFFALLVPFTLILHKWPKNTRNKFLNLSVFVFLFSFTYAIGYGMRSIMRLGSSFHMLKIRNYDYVYGYSHILTNPFDPFLNNIKQIFGYHLILGTGLVFLFVLFGIWFNHKKYRREIILLTSWWLLPILAIAEYSRVVTARYVLFSLPYLFVLAALSFANIREGIRNIMNFALILFILLAFRNDTYQLTEVEKTPLPREERSGYLEEWTAGTGIREVSELIRSEYRENPDKKIVVGTEGAFGTLPDGLQIYLNDIPEITVIGVGIDLNEVPEPLIESEKTGNKTYFVINDSRLLVDSKHLGLNIVAAYPKSFRKEGTKEFNIHGPRDTLYLYEVTEKSVEMAK